MLILELPPFQRLERLLDLVANEAPALLPGCRRLVLGPRLGSLVLPEIEPSTSELTALLRMLENRAPELLPLGRQLVRSSDDGETAFLELCVDRLLARADWEHPTQVLDRPRPNLERLLEVCRARQLRSGGSEHARIGTVVTKVERAARIAEGAARRRQRMRSQRRQNQLAG